MHRQFRLSSLFKSPWCRTSASFRGQVTINACKLETRDEKEKRRLIDDHKERVRKLAGEDKCLVIYSDGSIGFLQVRAAAVGFHKGKEVFHKRMGMGGRAEVHDAEMAGLMMGARLAARFTTSQPEITKVIFFVDSSAAAGAIFDPKPGPGQLYAAKFHHKMTKFLNGNTTHSIKVAWCPSHCNIPGNDRADELAKEATQLAWSTPIGTSRVFAL